MTWKKGQSGNANGRPKGSKNKFNQDIVQMILKIHGDLEKQGKGLKQIAKQDPKWFLENFVKPMIPRHQQFSGTDGEPIQVQVNFISADKAKNANKS